jgi:hypothetical protein
VKSSAPISDHGGERGRRGSPFVPCAPPRMCAAAVARRRVPSLTLHAPVTRTVAAYFPDSRRGERASRTARPAAAWVTGLATARAATAWRTTSKDHPILTQYPDRPNVHLPSALYRQVVELASASSTRAPGGPLARPARARPVPPGTPSHGQGNPGPREMNSLHRWCCRSQHWRRTMSSTLLPGCFPVPSSATTCSTSDPVPA